MTRGRGPTLGGACAAAAVWRAPRATPAGPGGHGRRERAKWLFAAVRGSSRQRSPFERTRLVRTGPLDASDTPTPNLRVPKPPPQALLVSSRRPLPTLWRAVVRGSSPAVGGIPRLVESRRAAQPPACRSGKVGRRSRPTCCHAARPVLVCPSVCSLFFVLAHSCRHTSRVCIVLSIRTKATCTQKWSPSTTTNNRRRWCRG